MLNLIKNNVDIDFSTLFHKGLESELYLTSDNKIFKFTSDKDEFEVAKMLLKRRNIYLADVFGVYNFPKNMHFRYGILLERLDPIQNEIELIFDSLSLFFEKNTPNYLGKPIEEFGKSKRIEWRKLVSSTSKIEYLSLFDAISNIFEETEVLGIQITDFHLGNIGLKNGHLAMFDIK